MSRPGFWRQAYEIARKDLRVEGRAGEVLYITIPFGAVALTLIPLAIGTDIPLLATIGPGMFWVVALLFGMLVTLRQTAVDGPPQQELLALLGVDPAAKFTGRTSASALLLLVFQLVLAPVTVVLYSPQAIPGWGWLAPIALLVAIGLGIIGTLAGAVTAGLRTRSTLAPLLVAPLAVPLLLPATQAMEALRQGRSILPHILLLLVSNLALAVVGVLTAGPLEEASQ